MNRHYGANLNMNIIKIVIGLSLLGIIITPTALKAQTFPSANGKTCPSGKN